MWYSNFYSLLIVQWSLSSELVVHWKYWKLQWYVSESLLNFSTSTQNNDINSDDWQAIHGDSKEVAPGYLPTLAARGIVTAHFTWPWSLTSSKWMAEGSVSAPHIYKMDFDETLIGNDDWKTEARTTLVLKIFLNWIEKLFCCIWKFRVHCLYSVLAMTQN